MKQCKRCNAILDDATNFCSACGSSEFIMNSEGGADSTPDGNGMMQQGEPVQGGPAPNYQQGGPMPMYQQPNYQQGGPAPMYQQPNYQQGGPAPMYQQPNYQQGGPAPMYQQPNYQQGRPAPMYQQPVYQVPPFITYNVPPDVDRNMVSRSEFLKKYADPALRKEWKSIGIFFYIAGGLSILMSLFMSSIWDVIFCLVLLGLAVGTHLLVNKVCAIILLVLSSLSTILCVVLYGMPAGWLWILVGVMAVTKASKINEEYKRFRYGGPF